MEGKRPVRGSSTTARARNVEKVVDHEQDRGGRLKGTLRLGDRRLNAIAARVSHVRLSIRTPTRAQIWKQDFEKNGPPTSNMVWLSSDPHAGRRIGGRGGSQRPRTGRSSTPLPHRKYETDIAILVLEDDKPGPAAPTVTAPPPSQG